MSDLLNFLLIALLVIAFGFSFGISSALIKQNHEIIRIQTQLEIGARAAILKAEEVQRSAKACTVEYAKLAKNVH